MIKRANILTNSFWYGCEVTAEAVVGAATSIASARVIGPTRLGYYVYLIFLTNVAGKLGGMGVAETARKFISQYLASGEPGVARAVFFATLRIQSVLALAIPAAGIALAWKLGDPAHWLVATLLVASLGPALLGSIAALANVAAENFSRNVPSALTSLFVYAAMVTLALKLDWGLVGLAGAVFLRRFIEMLMRVIPALRWMLRVPKVTPPEGLRRKLMSFSGQALGVAILTLVVWDRFEVVFLKYFCEVRQLAYYSVAFSLTEYVLMIPNVIGGAIGAALMAECGREGEGAAKLATSAVRRLSVLIAPLYVGMAALSVPFVTFFYGAAYIPAIPALTIAALVGMPKAFYWLPTTLFRAANRQSVIMRWLLVTAVVNVVLNLLLVPRFGAAGAAVANGAAQSCAVLGMWRSALRVHPFEVPWKPLIRTAAAAAAMGIVVFAFTRVVPPFWAILGGIPLGAACYMVALRVSRAIGAEDAGMLEDQARRLHGPARRALVPLLGFLAPAKPGGRGKGSVALARTEPPQSGTDPAASPNGNEAHNRRSAERVQRN